MQGRKLLCLAQLPLRLGLLVDELDPFSADEEILPLKVKRAVMAASLLLLLVFFLHALFCSVPCVRVWQCVCLHLLETFASI